VAIAGQSLSIDLQRSCKNVERHVRLAVSDWLYFLSRLSLSSDTWLYDCEWWMKQVPLQLDVHWAFESISGVINRPGMLRILVVKVDEICASMDRSEGIDFPKSMYELRDALELLIAEVEDAGLAV